MWLLRVGFDLSWICCKNANSYIALLILSKKSYNKVAFSPCSYSPPQFLIWSTSCRKEWLTTWLLGQQKLWVVIHWLKHSSRAWVDLHTLVFVSFYFIYFFLRFYFLIFIELEGEACFKLLKWWFRFKLSWIDVFIYYLFLDCVL